MYTHVYICDLGWSLSKIWINNTLLIQNIGVERLIISYLHERHLFPLSHDINREYEVFKNFILDKIKSVAEDIYTYLDRDIDLLRIQPQHDRHLFLTGVKLSGNQLYLYLF